MVNPFDQVNQAMKDRDDKFTKREMAAIYVMAGIYSNAQLPDVNAFQIAQLAIKATDILLQELGKPRNGN